VAFTAGTIISLWQLADIRGSTSLAETRLPYDAVFLLSALFRVLADVVEKSRA